MKKIIAILLSILFGMILSMILVMKLMPEMMFSEVKSKFGFQKTIQLLKKHSKKYQWTIPISHNLQKDYIRNGIKDMSKIEILYFCNAEGGYEILKKDSEKKKSPLMPMGVSVYEKSDGSVYVSAINLSIMSKMMSGKTKEVMEKGGENLNKTFSHIMMESDKEIQSSSPIALFIIIPILLILLISLLIYYYRVMIRNIILMMKENANGTLTTFAFLSLIPFPIFLILGLLILYIWDKYNKS